MAASASLDDIDLAALKVSPDLAEILKCNTYCTEYRVYGIFALDLDSVGPVNPEFGSGLTTVKVLLKRNVWRQPSVADRQRFDANPDPDLTVFLIRSRFWARIQILP